MSEDDATKLELVNADDVINNVPINERDFYRGDKKLPKENAQFNFTPAMVKELKKCRDNIVHFAENHFTIVNLDRGKETIELYPAQKRVLKSLQNDRFVVLLSSRQAGKCLKDDTIVRIRDKKTLESKNITVGEFYSSIKS